MPLIVSWNLFNEFNNRDSPSKRCFRGVGFQSPGLMKMACQVFAGLFDDLFEDFVKIILKGARKNSGGKLTIKDLWWVRKRRRMQREENKYLYFNIELLAILCLDLILSQVNMCGFLPTWLSQNINNALHKVCLLHSHESCSNLSSSSWMLFCFTIVTLTLTILILYLLCLLTFGHSNVHYSLQW